MDDFSRSIEFIVIAVYMLFLLGIGFAFKNFNSNISDFFRGGGRATWWMVGTSAFMASISAYTFTGASGVAFEAGWSVSIIYIANSLGFLLAFLFFAPWFRQIRAITGPEVIRMRYGILTQQFYAGLNILLQMLGGGLQLWAMAIFTSAVFGFDIGIVIVVIGFVVVFYSTTGGNWAVMATDFVQSLIMIPLTILIAIICLIHMGGFSGMAELVGEAGLKNDFRIINDSGDFPFEQFTFAWAIALIINSSILSNTMVSGQRYFSVKDGRDARKAAFLAFILMSFGCIFWFIPPMTARLFFEAEVLALGTNLNNPAEASYALTSLKLLPMGMTGLIVVAMFSATMSSLDSGINRNAGIFVRDIYPALCRCFRIREMGEKGQLLLSRIFSLFFGLLIILTALYFALAGGRGMFDVMLTIAAMFGIPLAIPMLLGLFFKKVPSWSALFSVIAGASPAIYSHVAFLEWNFQTKAFMNLSFGTVAFIATLIFWPMVSNDYRKKVESFFERMYRPVDFEKEIGQANDLRQLSVIGAFTIAIASFLLLLLLLPNEWSGRLAILSLAGTVMIIGSLMYWAGRKVTHK